MSRKNNTSIPIRSLSHSSLDNSQGFKLIYDKKKSLRNGLLLIIIGILFGASAGAIIDLFYLYTQITNEYAIMGIGMGVGALFGIILGLILIVALKSKMVDDLSASYGAGIGTNVFVGAVIGIFFGAIVGALFGSILKVLEFTNYTTLSIPVFAILIWTVLGLNIGTLIGVIASFGTTKIYIGGAISGVIVGGAGMLAIFGPDVLVAIGIGIGLVVGIIVAIFVKYGLEANSGKITYKKYCNRTPTSDEKSGSSFMSDLSDDRRRRRRSGSDCGGGGDCSGCGSSDCSGCEGCLGCGAGAGGAGGAGCGAGGCGAGISLGPIFMMFLIAIPFILLTIGLSFVGKRASIKFGGTVKKGALTALGASFSIFLIIGSNIGLAEAYHNMLFWHNVLTGAGIGLIYGLLIYITYRTSIRNSFLKLTPNELTWKDRHTADTVILSNIKHYEFVREERIEIKKEGYYEDYFKFTTFSEISEKVLINCWETPEGSDSTVYIQTNLENYLRKKESQRKQRIKALEEFKETEPLLEKEVEEIEQPEIRERTGYSFDLSTEITENMVNNVSHLLEKAKNVSINWLVAVTKYEKEIVEEIIIVHLGLSIKNGKILK
ncbi:MAG: hypothetical protein ACTSUW_00980 [Candidatus Heimdallarchaeota archaeon]